MMGNTAVGTAKQKKEGNSVTSEIFFSFGWADSKVHVFVLALLGRGSAHYLYKVTSVADYY